MSAQHTAHTPGPWRIHEEPPFKFQDGAVDQGGYRIDALDIEQLAFVWRANTRWGTDNPAPFGAAEAEANARLIAAAPDLLAALKDLHEAVCSGGYPHAAMKAAEVAITRAEGRTP